VWLPFPSDWTEEDVARHEDKIKRFCDEILERDAWTVVSQRRGGSTASTGYYDEGLGEDMMSIIEWTEEEWARGWEPSEDTFDCDVDGTFEVEWELIDKTRRYFLRPVTGRKTWRIPK